MAERTFEIRTEAHKANIGAKTLLFEPETNGAAFAGAYAKLKEAQQKLTAAGDNIGEEELTAVNTGMRDFVRRFLLEESKAGFDEMAIPDRVLVQLLEWTAELYGGGSGKSDAPGTSSSDS